MVALISVADRRTNRDHCHLNKFNFIYPRSAIECRIDETHTCTVDLQSRSKDLQHREHQRWRTAVIQQEERRRRMEKRTLSATSMSFQQSPPPSAAAMTAAGASLADR